jgi:RNA polymerase sigma-70 factor, ECF subfamily
VSSPDSSSKAAAEVATSEKRSRLLGAGRAEKRLNEPFSGDASTDEDAGLMPRGRPALEIVAPVSEPKLESAVLDADSVFRRYAAYVAAIAHRLLGRDQDVDDTVQEVFVIAVRGLSQLREPAAVKGWLAKITVRVSRRRLRMRRLRTMLGLDEDTLYDSMTDESASPEQRVLIGRVYRLLDGIPADHRIAWSLRHMEGEKLEDVAALCGCSLATAKRRIAAAARVLEEALSDE